MMTSSDADITQLAQWLDAVEGERFEFKEAATNFSDEKLAKYCCSLANSGGGRVLLGVTDRRPRRVTGTLAYLQIEDIRKRLADWLHLRIEVQSISHPLGRVLVFDVPSRPVGLPIKYSGVYWARDNDSLVPMGEDALRATFAEAGHDHSADVCVGATMADLDVRSIEDFRHRWIVKSGNSGLASVSREQLLRDADLLLTGGVTYAALVLFGTRDGLTRWCAQAEVVLEYRSSEAAGPAQMRKEYREGFFACYEDLWTAINLRNDVQHYQDGLFMLDIATFDERSVREAVLNAVCHRDYQLGGSVFIRQYARRLVVESPGGFPAGVTVDNVLDRQSPRNRRIANAFLLCGLVERSGQGMNLMFERSIRQGKAKPGLAGTDPYLVVLTLDGNVSDPRFVQFLERVALETGATFDSRDFIVLDQVLREERVGADSAARLWRLAELGAIETIGRGKGTRYMLSRRFYELAGRKGAYTRRAGLDDATHKELLLRHLRENPAGSALSVLHQVLPHLGARKVQLLLRELRRESRVELKGERRWARWKAKDSVGPDGP